MSHYAHRFTTLVLTGFLIHAAKGAPIAPADSVFARTGNAWQQLLLSPFEADSEINKAGWKLKTLAVEAAPAAIAPKLGRHALVFRGEAESAGAKGDFTVADYPPGQTQMLGLWVYLTPDANVSSFGLQLHDSEGESLLAQVPGDWTGWKWIEFDLNKTPLAQTYKQDDRNSKLDQPLQSIHVVWFAKNAGPTSVVVDALTAATQLDVKPNPVLQAKISGATWGEPGAPLSTQIITTNFSNKAETLKLEFLMQRDSALFSQTPPDPVYGSDHALGAKSWTEMEGKKLEEGSLTDGKDWTNIRTPHGTQISEAFQFIDLGRERKITRLGYLSGDANWAWKLDVSASSDGQNYQPVPGLQDIDVNKKWGRRNIAVPQPFNARYVRLRHHKDGEKVQAIGMPSAFSVYDGAADENWNLPQVGEEIARGTLNLTVPAHSWDLRELNLANLLTPGAYLVAIHAQQGAQNQLIYRHYLVLPPAMNNVSAGSRFGINSSVVNHTPSHQRLGIGWVRFENMKWPMMSPAQDIYKFDGTVGPWYVNHDAIVDGYKAQGLNILPFLFLTPEYATSAPTDVPKNRWSSYPPKDNQLMADFVFQTVARYGTTKHSENILKSPDKKSGLNKINVFEIWNEPNLTAASWGPWVGTSAQYMEMFRAAAQAVKQADPKARVTNGGYAGIAVETVDELRAYKYADGKRPLDFVDILNVHYYSGQTAPEIATVDTNVIRTGSQEGARTYEDDLRRLSAWRDTHKPGMPIWLTETGYDTAGPKGVSEQLQAARLPRVIMLALANGIEKVFIYREAGSTPGQHAASGLLRNDGSMKPSWVTYATMIRELDGTEGGRRLPHPNPNVRLYLFPKGNDYVLSAWTVDGTANLDLNLGNSTLTDAFGHRATQNINANFSLSIFPVYIRDTAQKAPINALLEQARRDAEKLQQEKARQAKLRTYLFDFGSTDKIGTIELGTTRNFLPVLANDIYDEAKGFGFTPRAAMRDEVAGWINDPLERDSARINKDVQFRFKAAPGRYILRAGVAPFGERGQFTIKGAAGGDKTITVTKAEPLLEATVEVGNEPLSLETDGYALLRWIALIEDK